jgi:2-polyprenyl-6-methoxyphenol hydroxylase-like FAD-dependent oxidoreductase
MTLPCTTDVLIVGAGPTGLTLATALTKLGVEVTVVALAGEVRCDSRAAGVQPRTLEELDRIGAAEQLIELGLRGTGFTAATRNETLLQVSFTELDTPYPFVLHKCRAGRPTPSAHEGSCSRATRRTCTVRPAVRA